MFYPQRVITQRVITRRATTRWTLFFIPFSETP